MPHVIVKLYPGRSERQKQDLPAAMTRAVMDIIGSAEASVSVAIEDVAPGEWVEKVWQPEIEGKADRLYKRPGYEPG